MIDLYLKRGCPYCKKVLDVIHGELSLPFCGKYIRDEAVVDELVERGGKRQVPYMVDKKNDVEMYESEDIVEYLRENYGVA